jgi:hypothetical protein
MFVPDDRFSQVAGMRADGAVPVESRTYGEAIGSIRRECLDRMLIFGEAHLGKF